MNHASNGRRRKGEIGLHPDSLGESGAIRRRLEPLQFSFTGSRQHALNVSSGTGGHEWIELTRVRPSASSYLNWGVPAYFTAAFFCAAQRFFTASAMRLRPSGVSFLFFLAGFVATGAATTAVFLGRPGDRRTIAAVPSLSNVRAC